MLRHLTSFLKLYYSSQDNLEPRFGLYAVRTHLTYSLLSFSQEVDDKKIIGLTRSSWKINCVSWLMTEVDKNPSTRKCAALATSFFVTGIDNTNFLLTSTSNAPLQFLLKGRILRLAIFNIWMIVVCTDKKCEVWKLHFAPHYITQMSYEPRISSSYLHTSSYRFNFL